MPRQSASLLFRPLHAIILQVLLLLSLSSVSVFAQSPKLLSQHRDWAAYVLTEDGSKVCYMLSIPMDMEPKNVRRGDVYFIVTQRPVQKIKNEISITTGYTYKPDSTVNAQIGAQSFELFTQGDTAWLYDARDEANMVGAMKRGNQLIVKGTSSRGTVTTDRYSLLGFTAAYNAISQACR